MISPSTPIGYSGMNMVYLSHVNQKGHCPVSCAAYHGYRITSDTAQAITMAPAALLDVISGMARMTAYRTLARPVH